MTRANHVHISGAAPAVTEGHLGDATGVCQITHNPSNNSTQQHTAAHPIQERGCITDLRSFSAAGALPLAAAASTTFATDNSKGNAN